MNEAILIHSDEWEGLFVNGKLVQEGHTLNEGYSRIKYFNKLAKQYDFKINQMKERWVTGEYADYLLLNGGFHTDLIDVGYII
jgi:hypothetical protein